MERWENALEGYDEAIQAGEVDRALLARDALLRELPQLRSHAAAMKIFAAAHQHNDAQLRYEAYFMASQLTSLSHWHASHTALDFNDLIVLYEYHNDITLQDLDRQKLYYKEKGSRFSHAYPPPGAGSTSRGYQGRPQHPQDSHAQRPEPSYTLSSAPSPAESQRPSPCPPSPEYDDSWFFSPNQAGPSTSRGSSKPSLPRSEYSTGSRQPQQARYQAADGTLPGAFGTPQMDGRAGTDFDSHMKLAHIIDRIQAIRHD